MCVQNSCSGDDLQMPSRKQQKNCFPVKRFLAIKQNQDVQLACALVKDKEYLAEAKKNKAARVKGTVSQIKYPFVFVIE